MNAIDQQYTQQIDFILDKLLKFNKDINQLDKIEVECLSAYAENRHKDALFAFNMDDARTFYSDEGDFVFKHTRTTYNKGFMCYFGTIFVPDYTDEETGTVIPGALHGYIEYVPENKIVLPFFGRDNADILDFCNGLECELDTFLETVCHSLYNNTL
jgi:hypothetical protein